MNIPSQFCFEGLLIHGAAGSFASFYRARVRYQEGARLPATDLLAAYAAWSDERDLLTSSPRAIRTFMEANGHAHRKSNRVYYRDAVLGNFEGMPLPVRKLPIVDGRAIREGVTALVDEIDQMIVQLVDIRSRAMRLFPSSPARQADLGKRNQ